MAETRCWLVERDYWDEDLVTLVYATPDGERAVTLQLSTTLLVQDPPTAARTVADEDLERVADPDDRARYAREASRVAERHDPDDEV
ncbi:MAG: hypothetical protein ABEJ89_01730 [Haloarculaceae archaeon]